MSGSEDMNWDPDQAHYKYTDTDVRRHPGYHDLVVSYLDQYVGSFEFLVDLKRRVDAGGDLTTGMVRGVLNCMRTDPRVSIPDPAELPRRKKSKKGKKRKLAKVTVLHPVCELVGEKDHNSHWMSEDRKSTSWCRGWHAINRAGHLEIKARFHLPYVRSTNSNLIHRSSHEGRISWYMPTHAYGPGVVNFWYVKTVCPIQDLTNPIQLDADGVRAAQPLDRPSASVRGKYPEVTLCGRCFPEGDL